MIIVLFVCITLGIICCGSLGYPGQSSINNPTRTDPLGTELQYPEIVPCIYFGRVFLSSSFRAKCRALNTALMFPGSVHVK